MTLIAEDECIYLWSWEKALCNNDKLLTDIDKLDPVLLNGVQGYGNVFEFVVLVERPLVVTEFSLL